MIIFTLLWVLFIVIVTIGLAMSQYKSIGEAIGSLFVYLAIGLTGTAIVVLLAKAISGN